MRPALHCYWHEDHTASLKLMSYGWYCWGCGKRPTKEEVEAKAGKHYEYTEDPSEKEDVAETLRHVEALPRRTIRGLNLHADEGGYFVVWTGEPYYKYRRFDPGKGPKYVGPKGHKPPLFWAKKAWGQKLAVVEGELNAMSVSLAYPEWDVCSPGSATMFKGDNLSKHLTTIKAYSNVVVILDDDAAGTKAFIESKALLLHKIPFLDMVQMKVDANELLCNGGEKMLREELQRQGCR